MEQGLVQHPLCTEVEVLLFSAFPLIFQVINCVFHFGYLISHQTVQSLPP